LVLRDPFRAVDRILATQLTVIVVLVIGFYLLGSNGQMISAFYGGMIAFVPNLYMVLRLRKTSGKAPKELLHSLYIGEAVKLILTATLFILVFQLPDVEILPLLLTFSAVLAVFWLALFTTA